MRESVVIEERFHGPADSANGGFASAITARRIDGPAEVTLRVPPPLGRPLELESREDSSALLDGDVLVAEGKAAVVDVEVPPPVSLMDAEVAATRYPWRDRHPYPTCFVCGPEREPGDGLGIHPGPVDDRAIFASPWTPAAEFGDPVGEVRPEFVWAALDCPGGVVTDLLGEVGRILLGRLAVDIRGPVRAGDPYVVQSWPIERDGRKLHTASALFTETGDLRAVGRAVWIEVSGD